MDAKIVQPEHPTPGKAHPFLNSELYEKCSICKGTTKILIGNSEKDGKPCPECGRPECETPGFIKIGMTVGQLERMHGERDLLTQMLLRLEEGIAEGVTNQEMLDMLADVKRCLTPSTLSAARLELNRKAMAAKRANKNG